MRSIKRALALAIAGTLLASCGHKDKDAPLAFVPADTPYVVANLDVLDEATRKALLAQADLQMPTEVAQLRASAAEMAATDPDSARLLTALATELDGQSIESFAQRAGLNIKGHSALYGLGLAPVLRFELADAKAFESFIARLETAYGKKFDVATIGSQSYRKHVSAEAGTEVVVAVVGKQAVAAVLPANASDALLRQALGLDRPAKSLQDDGRLDKLAKANGYQKWAVGQLDLTRALPLAASGKDPLFSAMMKAHAVAESARTGEPVANQIQIPASCQADAARIAARVPGASFGYTALDAKHQDMRVDISLADDITEAFAAPRVNMPGLGAKGTAPFDLTLALPVAQLRAFWSAQAEAVAARPFSCPQLSDLNDDFAKLGPALQKAALPPFGDLLGVRIALDRFSADTRSALPSFSGRLVVGTSNPAGLLAMGQMLTPALAQLKLTSDGKPVALPANLSSILGQPAWLAMGSKALALGIGADQGSKLTEALQSPGGEPGRMLRMHLTGDMYLSWITLMQQKSDSLGAAAAAMTKSDNPTAPDPAQASDKAASAARTKAQFDAMRAQAARIETIDAEAHVDRHAMVITSQTKLK